LQSSAHAVCSPLAPTTSADTAASTLLSSPFRRSSRAAPTTPADTATSTRLSSPPKSKPAPPPAPSSRALSGWRVALSLLSLLLPSSVPSLSLFVAQLPC
jgi:hypothetical protein